MICRFLFALVLSFYAVIAFAADWSVVLPTFRDSIVEIAIETGGHGEGGCTGFVIDNNRDFVMTAAHCDVPNETVKLLVDSLVAKVRAKDTKNDLMVLFVEGIDRPALKLAVDDPRVGDEVASFGYGYALERPLFRMAHVSATDLAVDRGRYIVIDSTFVPGQSGGPVVNDKGEVVMIVQMGNNLVGLGIGAETIRDKFGRFFTLPNAKQ